MCRLPTDCAVKRFMLHVWMFTVRIVGVVPLLWLCVFLHFAEEGTGLVRDAMFNALLLIVWCVFHSISARPSFHGMISGVIPADFIRSAYVVVSGATLAVVLWFWRPLEGSLWHAEGLPYLILTALYLSCIVGMYTIARLFDRAEFIGTRVFVRMLLNKPPKTPVFTVRGPYAYCRHPMYLLLLGVLWIGPVMTYGRVEFAAIASLYLFAATFFEEHNLVDELGPAYEEYRRHVPMWIPRLTPWRGDALEADETPGGPES
jgi:methanethiol S-methyltransferase